MFHHTPPNYVCPFCFLAQGKTHPDLETHTDDIFYQNEHITAFIASRWWPNNPGHALIVPNRHIENIYDLVPEIAGHVHEAARQTAIAFKEVYQAEGTSTRQHTMSLRVIRRCFTIICMCSRATTMIICMI